MRKVLFLILAASLFTASCSAGPERFQTDFIDLFDTYTVVMGYAESEAAFNEYARAVYEKLSESHKLFDIYHEYPGINNLKTVNDSAGIAPVAVSGEIIELLEFSRAICGETDGAVNVALGPVLKIWHEYREKGLENPKNAALPSAGELAAAAANTDINDVIIDAAAGTVFLRKPGMSLDAGASAKGYAAQKALEAALAAGAGDILISVGGNVVCAGGPPGGGLWNVGIQDPNDPESLVDTVRVTDTSVVSSGAYQRFYTVGGKKYGHIIDPETLFPAERYAGVTVIAGDSAIADALSTALFILPLDGGKALAAKYGAAAVWVYTDGKTETTGDYKAISAGLNGD